MKDIIPYTVLKIHALPDHYPTRRVTFIVSNIMFSPLCNLELLAITE